MKFTTENKYVKWSVCVFLVLAAAILLWTGINNINCIIRLFKYVVGVLKPFIYGFIIAYFFNYPYKKIMALFDKIKTKKPVKRGLKVGICLTLTYLLLLSAIALFAYIVVPVVVTAAMDLAKLIPGYIEEAKTAVGGFLSTYLQKFGVSSDTINNTMGNFVSEASKSVTAPANGKDLTSLVVSATAVIKNLSLGLVVSIYFLVDKNRFIVSGKKIVYALAGKKKGDRVLEVLAFTDKTFGGFIVAKVIDSIIIGFGCYAGMLILGLDDYPVLISTIVGVTNVIPFVGPFIGAGLSLVLILAKGNLWGAVIFTIFIFALQQFDGNVLGPKLLGDLTGIRAIYVMFAVIVGGGLLGGVGMFLGVPIFAVAYALISETINDKIKKMDIKIE